MQIFSVALAVFAGFAQTLEMGSSEAVVNLTQESFKRLVIDPTNRKLVDTKPWFIKFYAPWCGHCKHLAPVWEDLAANNLQELNVGKVDCTTDESKDLCSQYEVRGYPTLLYFPVEEDRSGKYQKYQGGRSMEQLEEYSLKGGYLSSQEEIDEIPKNLQGFEYWQKQGLLIAKDFAREIDQVFIRYGFDKMVPPVYRYLLLAAFCCTPIALLFVLICCCDDSYPVP